MPKSIKLSLFLLFFLISTMLYGQSYVGLFGGLNMSKLSGDSPEDASYGSLMGPNLGINVDLKLGKSLWLSLQPSFSQEGTKVSYNVSGQDEPVDSITVRLKYISLPLLLKVNTPRERFYAIGGIETSFLLDAYQESHDIEESLRSTVSDLNIALHFGIGIHIPLGFPRLFVELRYTQGLVNLTDEPNSQDVIPRVKTNGFKVFAGIEFPFKNKNN